MNDKKWLARIVEDSEGNLVLSLPEKLVEKLGWNENDTLVWSNNKGIWSLKQQKDT